MLVLGASWRITLPVAVIATVVIHLSFYKLLRIPLPWGIFEQFAF
jgi:putative tricarboxylic transport membrane protein